jgi:hypothetical protein
MNITDDKNTKIQIKSHLQLIEKHAKLLSDNQLYELAITLHRLKFYVLDGSWFKLLIGLISFAFKYPNELMKLISIAKKRIISIINRRKLMTIEKR